jgi:DNA-binding response OmpR family regulator
MATHHLQHPSSTQNQHALLIAGAEPTQRAFLAGQLDADGHTVNEADHAAAVLAKLSGHAVDVLVLGDLERPSEAPALLRSVRAGEHPRVHPGLPVITLGAADELTALRAYENGSDHHLPTDTGYVVLRAVITSLIRRVFGDVGAQQLQIGDITIDLVARSATVAGSVVQLSRLEYELLATFAGEPTRLFTKHDLARRIWRGQQICDRTVNSHVNRLRNRLRAAGAGPVLTTRWGQGWSLVTPH